MIWDDHQNKCIGELKFRTEVKAVKLRRDRIVVVLDTKVFVYRFKDLKLLDSITTVSNPKGLISLCPDKNNVLAIPGLAKGSIRIELYDISKATLIKAHDTDLAQFSLNTDGSRVASASEKGTLIRLWNCFTGEPLRELRRGMDRADIYSIVFNQQSTHIACSSDKGTIHIFSLLAPPPPAKGGAGGVGGEGMGSPPTSARWASSDNASSPSASSDVNLTTRSSSVVSNKQQPKYDSEDYHHHSGRENSMSTGGASSNNNNKTGMMGIGFLKGILPSGFVPKYFESEWSFAQVRGIEGKAICAFSKDSSKIHIICSDGNFIIANVEEGECSRISTTKYLKTIDELTNDDDFDWNNNTHHVSGGGGPIPAAPAATTVVPPTPPVMFPSSSGNDLTTLSQGVKNINVNNSP
jgi:WD40 repeat protein